MFDVQGRDSTAHVVSSSRLTDQPLKSQLLKWIGNKQRFAEEIISFFPEQFGTFYEPFIGSGAVIATLAPREGFGSDGFKSLAGIWEQFGRNPGTVLKWYKDRWLFYQEGSPKEQYEAIKARYNAKPNAADLLFLSRSCYGGVVRFRKADGYMSTPVGPHKPITPESFEKRVRIWQERLQGTRFAHLDFRDAMDLAGKGDLIYCDPPYSDSQTILYGAQSFDLEELFDKIAECKRRGAKVVLSIDGTKKSGDKLCDINIPAKLFKQELMVNCGRSMLKRFQMAGKTLEKEVVADRLLLTY